MTSATNDHRQQFRPVQYDKASRHTPGSRRQAIFRVRADPSGPVPPALGGAASGRSRPIGRLRAYAAIPKQGPLSDDQARTLIHGYYACVSYTDAQIGKLLDELQRLGLTGRTIVVLWGDHGWNLGEHTLWCKHCSFETSMHAPLIVKAPGIEGGVKTNGLTEFIDIYPSLCELAGLPLLDHLQGKSFVPLMKNPQQKWKEAAIGRYRNGDTIRTDKYRFSEYRGAGGDFLARMLYDHESDPQEDVNISELKASESIARELAEALHKGQGRE